MSEVIEKLKVLSVYNNSENLKYPLKLQFSQAEIKQMMDVYILQCAIQEYSFCHVKNSNKLLMSSMNAHNFLFTLEFLIKNNSGVRFITSRFK